MACGCAEPLVAKTTADVQTLLKFTEYRPTLEVRALVHVQDRPIFRVEMLLPDDLKVHQVSAPGDFQWALTERQGHPLLTVYFTAGQSGDVPVVVQGTLGGAGKIASLPLPAIEVCGVERQSGDIAVQADPAFDVEHGPLQDCQEAELAQVSAWLNPEQRQLTQLALHYVRPGYGGTLRLAARTPDVSCDTTSRVRVGDRKIEETVVLTFTVGRAGIRKLSFQLPASMAEARISAPMLRWKTVEPIERPADESTDNAGGKPVEKAVRVRVELQDERMGQIHVLVENDRLPAPKTEYSVPIPLVETGRTNRQYVALQRAGRDELKVKTAAGLSELGPQEEQWRALEAVIGRGITHAYVAAASKPALTFETVRHEDVQVVGARIGLAYTTLVLDDNGAYRAVTAFRVDNATEQFLQVDLPESAELWSAVVADEPVTPVQGTAANPGRVLIPLVKTAAGDLDYAAVLVYGGKMPALGRFSSVNFPLLHTANINVERSVVQLRLPESYRWFDFGGTAEMADEAGVAVNRLSYQAGQVERLMEVLHQSDPHAQARAMKAIGESLHNFHSTTDFSRIQSGKPRAELERVNSLLEKANRELGEGQKQTDLNGGGNVDIGSLESARAASRSASTAWCINWETTGRASRQPSPPRSKAITLRANSIPAGSKGRDSTRTMTQVGRAPSAVRAASAAA